MAAGCFGGSGDASLKASDTNCGIFRINRGTVAHGCSHPPRFIRGIVKGSSQRRMRVVIKTKMFMTLIKLRNGLIPH